MIQRDIFEASAMPVEREDNPRPPNWYELVGRRKLGQPDSWEVHTWKKIGPDGVQVIGGIPIGRRKDGSPKWGPRSGDLTCVVLDSEFAAARARYEAEEGKCADCAGCGRESSGYSMETGPTWRDCRRCGATGKPST